MTVCYCPTDTKAEDERRGIYCILSCIDIARCYCNCIDVLGICIYRQVETNKTKSTFFSKND